MKRYKVDLAVGMKRDTVYTLEKANEIEAIRFAVGFMKLNYNIMNEDGYFVYSVELVETGANARLQRLAALH